MGQELSNLRFGYLFVYKGALDSNGLIASEGLHCGKRIVFAVTTEIKASDKEDGFHQCEHIVKKWASSSLDAEVKEDKHVLREMLYFLHVPRTGGRTYYHWYI